MPIQEICKLSVTIFVQYLDDSITKQNKIDEQR